MSWALLPLLAALAGCGSFTRDPAQRAVTQTLAALTTQGAEAPTIRPELSTPEIQTPAPLVTGTPVPTATATLSPTPSVIRVRVSIDTNCRSGPGRGYAYVGALMVGETAVVISRGEVPGYVLIENPDAPGRECWLWMEFAELIGTGAGDLPLSTAPASPTAGLAALAGWVYQDLNDNQQLDEDDLPISNASLVLRSGLCPGQEEVVVVRTATDGRYTIRNLSAGAYCLVADASQAGFNLIPAQDDIRLSTGEIRDGVNFRHVP
jgi:hypothetical protein